MLHYIRKQSSFDSFLVWDGCVNLKEKPEKDQKKDLTWEVKIRLRIKGGHHPSLLPSLQNIKSLLAKKLNLLRSL